jgi:hypothetical protein
MADHIARVARSRVVLVGVASYADPALPDLPSGDQTALDLADSLAKWSASGSVVVEAAINPNRGEFVRALAEACADAEDEDEVVLYFSGHGVVSPFGELILATHDFDFDAPELTGVPWSSVRRTLSETAARSVIVILDCCFSGAANSALQETWKAADQTVAGTREPQRTYLMAGRAPWPYQPGVLGEALRSVINTLSAEEGVRPDLAAAAMRSRRELSPLSQPKLVTSGSISTADDQRFSTVFISSRVEDNDAAVALDRALTSRLGEGAVFRPAKSIPSGANFSSLMTEALARSRVAVAVIGRDWESRLEEPNDWVVKELASAFERGIPVVPVLVGARGPLRASKLPERLQQLARLQYLRIDALETVDAIVGRLLQVLPPEA